VNTDNKNASFYVAYILKKLWGLAALSLVVLAVCLSLLRYSLPYLGGQKQHIETWLSDEVGAQIKIGGISARWQGAGPAIVLSDIELIRNPQSPISLKIVETAIEVNFWQSVFARQIQSNKFDLRSMQMTLELASLGQKETDYPIIDALESLFLQQLQSFSISDSKIILNTKKDQQVVLIDQVSWINKEEHHQGVGQLQIEEIAKNSAFFILDLYGNQEQLHGTFFAKGEEVDLSPWLEQLVSSEHQLVESRGSFVMWAAIEDKALQSIQLDLSNSRFNWKSPASDANDDDIQTAVLGGQINAIPLNNDWVFNLDNLTVQINDQVLVSTWLGKIDPAGNLSLQQEQPIKLAAVLPLLALGANNQDMQQLATMQPQATLNSLNLNRQFNGELALQASISDIQWQQTQLMPGMAGLDTELNWFNKNGRFNIKGKAGTLFVDQLLPDNIEYQRFYSNLYIQSSDTNLNISTTDSLFKSELITIHPSFSFNTDTNHLSLSSTIESLDVGNLAQIYPVKLIGEQTYNYLVDSLMAGQIMDAKIIYHGTLQDFPFKQDQGVFQAKVEVTDSHFKFGKQWPALTELDVSLLFENQGLSFNGHKGQLLDAVLTDFSATIDTLSKGAILNVDATAQASGQQALQLIQQSDLADTLGKTLEQVQVTGPLTAQLNLHIPLSGDGISTKGQVTLTDNQVFLPSLNLLLEQTNGTVSFVNEQVKVSELQAMLLNQPIEVALIGQKQDSGYQTDINLTGDWQVAPLLESYQPGLSQYLSGGSNWQASVAVTIPKEGYQYSAEIVSDLTQLNSDFPAPFAKTAEQSLPFVLSSQGNQQASSIKISLGDEVRFNGNLPHQDMQFSRAHLAVGNFDRMGMGLGFSISAQLDELDTAPWYEAIDSLISGTPKTEKPLLEAPKRIYINANTAIVASQKLNDLQIVAKNTDDSWLLDINAKQARIELALYKDWLNRGVNINADFIELSTWQEPKTDINTDSDPNSSPLTFTAEIDTLPPVIFSCNRCRFMGNDLGKIDFNLSRSATGMKIESLRLSNTQGLFYGRGDWFLVDGKSSTRLEGEFSSSDFGAFLKGFNFNSGIKDSKAHSTFDLSWQRAPYEFNFETLNGQIDWRLTDGYLTEVTDKGSRIFSLLSLESLVRKLRLDFRDVFTKGFFYDKITGSFQVDNGIAYTQDTVVDGGAGEIDMLGYTDLNAQQLNYQIDFTPNVTSSLPVIVAWMVNPVTAIAALAIDQVLTSAKVISNIKFSLTGSFDEPILKELGRDSKEVSLPASTQPEPKEKDQPVIDELDLPIELQVSEKDPVSG
jgi:uncharacterized protein (TIGR02099 family)